MLRVVGADEQVHRAGSQCGQHGNDALQIEEAQDEAEHPHADHVRGPEVAHQLTGPADVHVERFGGVLRHPLNEAQLAEDVAQRGDRQEQHADAPFSFSTG